MRQRIFQNTGEVAYTVVIFLILTVYFTALFQMQLPSKVENFALVASTIFAMVIFAIALSVNDDFTRLNIRLFHIAKATERALIENDNAERIEYAIKQADELSDYYGNIATQSITLIIFFIETIASIYLASLVSSHLG